MFFSDSLQIKYDASNVSPANILYYNINELNTLQDKGEIKQPIVG